MLVVLDSNIWISLAINQQLNFVAQLNKSNIIIATCKTLTEELADVIQRPKLKRYLTKDYIERFFQLYQLTSSPFYLTNIEDIVTDKKDNFLFSLCKLSHADYLVTGDKLLLKVDRYFSTSVVTLNAFREILQT